MALNKVWVKITDSDRYSQATKSRWKLGTIVGERTVKRYKDQISMADTLSGEMFWMEKRYLVEADGENEAIEVWQSETYEQRPVGVDDAARRN